MARPSKIENWIKALAKVLEDSDNALLCTDEELVMITNELLEEDDRVHYNTFKNWKAGNISDEYKELYEEFLSLYKKALIRERKSLMEKFKADE